MAIFESLLSFLKDFFDKSTGTQRFLNYSKMDDFS
ncbi:hypothetical protein CY0110_18187 [Crocosphaera chwakensis CCY0110]|uniref:Uncharacterized protein n=1 Tax=Crocosphaera chwakensis CCY0110 TaxID=391612 RepID=A3IIW9_9CHRO|nr:hypothetical protein CY0110_18187 [Crocosphaera chwakensis CCY0110]